MRCEPTSNKATLHKPFHFLSRSKIHPETIYRPHLQETSTQKICYEPKETPLLPREPCSLKQINVFRQNAPTSLHENSHEMFQARTGSGWVAVASERRKPQTGTAERLLLNVVRQTER